VFTLALLVVPIADPLPQGAVLRLGDIRFRAGGEVRHLRFAEDGAVLAAWVVGPNGELRPRAWDAATGFPVTRTPDRSPPDHEDGTTPAVKLPGDRVLTAGPGDAGRVWDANTGRQLARLTGHAAAVTAVAASADGKQLATGSTDGLVRIWDADTFRPLAEPRGNTAPVRAIRVSADGRRILTTADDGTARVWDLLTGKELRAFAVRGTVELTPTGTAVVVPAGGTAAVRDVLTGLEVVPENAPAPPARSVSEWLARVGVCAAVSPDGRTFAFAQRDGTIGLYETATASRRRTLPGHGSACGAIAFTPDGTRLLSAGGDHTVLVWDVRVQALPMPDAIKQETLAAKLWATMTTGRAGAAYLAMARLTAEPPAAVKMARLRLKPASEGEKETTATRLADTRAVELLESLGTADARAFLKELADGSPSAWRTREAARALERAEKFGYNAEGK
jgi:hypothetical protein